MGKILFILLAIIVAGFIFSSKNAKKLNWFFVGILFFPPAVVIIPIPFMNFVTFSIFILLVVTFFQQKNAWAELMRFPLKISLLINLLLLLCIGLFDDRLNLYNQLYRPITYFLETFFVIFLTYFYIKSEKDALLAFDFLIKLFIAFTLYGILNSITKHNEYYSFVVDSYGGRDFANDNMLTGIERFRVSSFAWHAIYYGFLVIMMILIEIFLFTAGIAKKKNAIYYIVFFLLFINLFLVNSRTPLFALAAGASIFILFAVKFTKKIVVIFAILVLGIVASLLIPKASDIIDKSIGTLTGREVKKESGSSMTMRQKQLDASEQIFSQSPILGHGFNYITEGLGYSSDQSKRTSTKDFAGFESYYFKLLIEQGLFGIVGNIIFFLAIVFWLIKSYFFLNPLGKKAVVFSISITVAFLIFIIGTGDLGSFPFFMAILGISMKLVTLSDKRKIVYLDISHLTT